jgi:gluconate 2-dehydrogenase gamma chain
MTIPNASHESESVNDTTSEAQTEEAASATHDMSRRDAVQLLAAIPAAIFWSTAEMEKARKFVNSALRATAEGVAYAPKFFTAAEYKTVRVLSDMIIPRDERSGSATDAGVPEFMDFWMTDRPGSQKWMRDGLAWINAQSTSRFGKAFADATET